jgi:hypothetical protein
LVKYVLTLTLTVFSVDEKSQIQALDRTQPILPLREGLPERQTHDYRRHGTTTLFAALNVLDGTVIGHCSPRHRHQEFLKFLKKLDETVVNGQHFTWFSITTERTSIRLSMYSAPTE